MHSSTAEMVEKKVLEMAQHASFHQHVSYNLSTILHAFTAGKTDPAEIAEAFSRARGLEVITRVVSGQPLAKPSVISLCCGVARRVIDKFGAGVAESQAGGLAEAVVVRLGLGVSGDDAQTVECQVECARLMTSIAGQAASVLLAGGALGTVEGMLERLGGKHSSIMRPCCEALERVSRTEEGRAVLEERGTGGILLATIRNFPDALDEGSDAALASALKAVERIFTDKPPEACALSLRAHAEGESNDDPHPPTPSDYATCVETLLAVAEATPEAPGAAAATCLWWLSGASGVAPDRALAAILAAGSSSVCTDEDESGEGEETEEYIAQKAWTWLPLEGGEEVAEATPSPRLLEAARFLATLCLCKPGLQRLEAGVQRESPRAVEALVHLCGSPDPNLARACFRIVERLAKGRLGARAFVDAGALARATEAGARFEVQADAVTVEDAEARAIAAALGTVAVLAEAGGDSARPLIEDAFQLSVRCLGRVGEFSGRPAAAAAKSALDVIAFRLTRPDRPKGAAAAAAAAASRAVGGAAPATEADGSPAESDQEDGQPGGDGEVDAPMEVLKDAGVILAAMKAHPSDARVQQSGWRSLIAMDTGRGGVERHLTAGGDGPRSRRQMLRDCLERHGGDSLVAGQVADILEELDFHGDSDGENSLTASLSDAHGEESPRWNMGNTEHNGDIPPAPEQAPSPTEGEPSPVDPSEESLAEADASATATAEDDAALEEAEPGAQEGKVEQTEACAAEEDAPEVTEKAISTEEDALAEGGAEENRDREAPGSPNGAATPAGEGEANGSMEDVASEGDGAPLSPDDVLVVLSRAGRRPLVGDGTDSDSSWRSTPAGAAAAGEGDEPAINGGSAGSRRASNVARSLFGVKPGGGGDEGCSGVVEDAERGVKPSVREAAAVEDSPLVLSMEELRLADSWTKLERLHGDVMGRSQILGGESAEMAAAMHDPSVLRKEVVAMLEGAGGAAARGGFAASSLAMVGALTAATGALARSQNDVQRYLTMSRDLRATSTWRDISDAMQWTMDTLKATVILFTPHTSHLLTKDLGLCKNMASAFKLFKEAALQIKIVVVELAGEHETNTVWRIAPGAVEGLPENRKVMMLRHLRSLVVAYDHLSDDHRRNLQTALEIIKNREVLNKMGRCCVEAEALEEKRRQAKIANAEERMRVGSRRPTATRSKRSPPSGARVSTSCDPRGSPNSNGAPSPPGAPFFSVSSTPPPGTPGSNGGSRPSPPTSGRKARQHSAARSARSAEGVVEGAAADGAGGASTGIPRLRGIGSKPRRRDSSMPSPRSLSKSPVPLRRASRSPMPVRGASKSPVRFGGAAAASPENGRRASRSPMSTPRKERGS